MVQPTIHNLKRSGVKLYSLVTIDEENTMSFSDPPPLPPSTFLPPQPLFSGNFWQQTQFSDDHQDSNPNQDFPTPPFKRPRNLEPIINQPNNFSPKFSSFQQPMNQPTNFSPNFTSFQQSPMNNPRGTNSPAAPAPPNKPTGNIFFKTRMCLKFLEGNCGNGDACTFAHGAEDLREPPPNWQEIAKGQGWNNNDERGLVHRMKICKKFYNGEECPYGDKCNFLHIDNGESSVVRIGTAGTGVGNGRDLNLGCGNGGNMKPTCWKTKLCSKWEMTGHCPFGERCHFAHGFSELQVPGARIEAEAVSALIFQRNLFLFLELIYLPSRL